MGPAAALGVPAMFAESAPEDGLLSRQCMRPDAHYTTARTQATTFFAFFEEEVHPVFGPVHAAMAIGEPPASADSFFDPPQKFVETGGVSNTTFGSPAPAFHGLHPPQQWSSDNAIVIE